MRVFAIPLFALLSMSAVPATAQNEITPDLDLMRQKASADPDLEARFDQLVQVAGRGAQPNVERTIRNLIVQSSRFRDLDLSEPVRIETVISLEPAQVRAQVAMQILAADLDGDWQITRLELTEALKYGMQDGAAQAFILADTNRDDILSSDEMKLAVEEMAALRTRGRNQTPSLLPILDFDADGYLSREEYSRAMAALRQ